MPGEGEQREWERVPELVSDTTKCAWCDEEMALIAGLSPYLSGYCRPANLERAEPATDCFVLSSSSGFKLKKPFESLFIDFS